MVSKLSDHERALEYATRKINPKNRATWNAVVEAVNFGIRFERDNGRGAGTAQVIRGMMAAPRPTTAQEICDATGLPRDLVSTHLSMMGKRKHAKRSGDKWTLTDLGMKLLAGLSSRRERKPSEARLRSINTMRRKEEEAKSAKGGGQSRSNSGSKSGKKQRGK
jgi:hypothetical protein